MKKNGDEKSRDTVPLSYEVYEPNIRYTFHRLYILYIITHAILYFQLRFASCSPPPPPLSPPA